MCVCVCVCMYSYELIKEEKLNEIDELFHDN